jgi:hypothetical protein
MRTCMYGHSSSLHALCSDTLLFSYLLVSILELRNCIRMVDPIATGIIYPEEEPPSSAKIELAWCSSCAEQIRMEAYFYLIVQAINAVENLEGSDATQRIARLLDKRGALCKEMKENLAVMSALQDIFSSFLQGQNNDFQLQLQIWKV